MNDIHVFCIEFKSTEILSSESSLNQTKISFEHKIIQLVPGSFDSTVLVNSLSPDKSLHLSRINLENQTIIDHLNIDSSIVNYHVRAFTSQYIIGTSFDQERNPDRYTVYVYDWQNDQPRLTFENTKLIDISENAIRIVHPMIVGKHVQIDLSSGQEIREPKENTSDIIPNQHPISYTQESEFFSWFQKLLKKFGFDPVVQCEHLKWDNLHIVSFYEKDQNKLKNHLMILDNEGIKINSYLLAQNLKGIAVDTFFVKENKLIFVDDQNVLSILYA